MAVDDAFRRWWDEDFSWEGLAQKPWIAPIPGTTKLHRLQENLGAVNVSLSNEDLRNIEAAYAKIEIVGARYPKHLMERVGK